MDWIETYLTYSEGLPSPEIFRLWGAITAISGALERRVWVEAGGPRLYPNLYTLLVGPPGGGKTQAITNIKDLWVRVGKNLHIAPDNVTKASLIDVLQRNSRFLIDPAVDPADMEYHTTLVAADEFGVFLSKHDLEFISVLNAIYDNRPNYREERRSMAGENPDISNPQLIMLCGTQPDFLASILPEEAWGMGFCSRIIMIYAPGAPKFRLFGAPLHNSDALKTKLLDGLTHMSSDEMYGIMRWTDAAKAALSIWYNNGMPPCPTHPRLQHYVARRLLQCIKLITISCISRQEGKLITEYDVERAISWLVAAEQAMPDVFRAMMSKSDSEILTQLHYEMWNRYGLLLVKDRRPIPEEDIYQFLKEKVPSDKIAKIIEVAEKSGILVHNAGGGWIPKPLHIVKNNFKA